MSSSSGGDDASESDAESCCQLGKHEYWEQTYIKEMENFQGTGDEGENW